MKKTLSVLAVLGVVSVVGSQVANAFDWSNLNPAYWGHCPRCEKKKPECSCKKETKKCDPCKNIESPCPSPTGAAAPCDPCAKKQPAPCDPCQKQTTQPQPCDACDKLQEMTK